MNLTSIVGKLFVPRQKELERHFTDGEQLQKQVLNRLLAQGANTEYGRKYDFANIHSYEEFTKLVPQTAYEELAPWIDRMRVVARTGDVVCKVEWNHERQIEVHPRDSRRPEEHSLPRK